jgi:purine nucleosidase
VIFDTDPSPDDAVAFLAALASPDELEVLAITTVAGNVPVELTSKNALKALELVRRTDIPVYAGAARPLARALVTAEHVHGETGFNGYELPEPCTPLQDRFAPDAIVDLVMSRPPGTVTLCCLAALTNIALALARDPRLAAHLAGIVLMGGSMSEGGNITASAEFNFYVDPEAAADVLRAPGTAVGDAFYYLLEFNKRFDRAKYGWPGGPLHDATVTAFLLAPELFTGRHVHVEIECDGLHTLGASVVDWWGVSGKPANALVLRHVDADAYFHLIFERLLRL